MHCNPVLFSISVLLLFGTCSSSVENPSFTEAEKAAIRQEVEQSIQQSSEATRNKDIDLYMETMPEDLVIYDESGEVISREMQKQYALRDWSIIDTTLAISVVVDSIQYLGRDSLFVYNSQRWERIMFRRDGITTDTVVTTQRHKETWKKNDKGWQGYEILELGGAVFINGEPYQQ